MLETLKRLAGYENTIWTRRASDKETRKLVSALGPGLDALEISGAAWAAFPFATYRSVHYPAFDVTRDVLPERFDVVVAEQIFEHLRHPYSAARNVRKMLRPGGQFLVVTPFVYKVHRCPGDYTRWTRDGLAGLLEDCGFKDVKTDSWGNRACIRANFRKEYHRFNRHLHSLKNEPDYPVSVWALARA